ncbi:MULTISPECIES: EAL domain-containing protein [Vibrio]|uniref:EAL domain-containing protein n=1 Tax=Vibrio TaxID=662 RepID=UPI0001B9586E|nr:MULTISPECIES: EAL domain-containing protein [Vibrio]EEX33405.1 sensory box/GGDEF family protein [Vibrio coralliilyticus ATCC BAA-450]MCM5508349.1 EAL domain-containing protein [Vibrio sp. SCSIO 43169]MDE3897055.1 EAL domain-containing protein [Vibrio sp. CC007]QFT38300.1 putative membrane protein YjcC [Vibrio sp. THAF64]QGM37162.1 putative membrane protein YjcC [Vibrio sp. THAF191d]
MSALALLDSINVPRKHLFSMLLLCLFNVILILVLIGCANLHLDSSTKQAAREIETHFDRIKDDFNYLAKDNKLAESCDVLLVEMRQSVFETHMAKEVAVFREGGQFFCATNKGKVSFNLYPHIYQELKSLPLHQTVAYFKAAINRLNSIGLLFLDDQQRGVSILIPPGYLFELIEQKFAPQGIDFDLWISGQLVDNKSSMNSSNSEVLRFSEYQGERFPFALKSQAGHVYYLSYIFDKYWVFLLVSSIVIVSYSFSSKRRIAKNSLEFSLVDALNRGYFECYYQPIIDASSHRAIGCEALLRWNDPKRGFVSPGIFIPLAEKLNLINRLTYYVFNQVVDFIAKNESVLIGKYVSINISRKTLIAPRLLRIVKQFQKAHPHILKKLVFEITENGEYTDEELEIAKKHIQELCRTGIRIAVDDFGTGYSGLNFVSQLPFEIMKIDRVFVKNLDKQQSTKPVLESMVNLARSRNMTVIVEGVETDIQLQILFDMGFVYIQGFLFARPMPEEEVIEYLKHINKINTINTQCRETPALES